MAAETLDDLLRSPHQGEPTVQGRHILVRSDLNVPLDGETVTDDGRIRASLPVIQRLADAGAKVIVMAHLGRPKGQPDPQFSLAPVAHRFAELTQHPVVLAEDTTGPSATAAAEALEDGNILLLENVRFDPRETSKNDEDRLALAKEMAQLAGDDGAYVNDAFGAAHRKHASVYDIATLLPSYQGTLVADELTVLSRLTESPERPYVVALGGSKVSDKLAVIENLMSRADELLIGGGMVFTFLKARGYEVASSLLEEDQIPVVQDYLRRAHELNCTIVLPDDIVMAESFSAEADHQVLAADQLEQGRHGANAIGLDIGPASAQYFAEKIRSAQTVFWNGPMGVFEMEAFSHGTRAVAEALTQVTGLSVVGGGDSAAAVRSMGFQDTDFGHISTGGGASLEYLEGKVLPGVEALQS